MTKIKYLRILLAGALLAIPVTTGAARIEQPCLEQSFGNCTTLMAHGKAAQGGGLILAKNRDQSYMTPSTVMVQPHKKYAAGTSVNTVTTERTFSRLLMLISGWLPPRLHRL